jgi:aspartyl-tRNA(Asn)/glutamyl-tRNA(Gln) amidotransferase subunit B
MNSFRFIERGIDAEIARQKEILADGGSVTQETLHFDPQSGTLSSLRSKEEAHDYRYFPEPDLVALAPTPAMIDRARAALPELPAARAERLERGLELPAETAKLLAFRTELGDFFEAALDPAAQAGADARTLANWVTNDYAAKLGDGEPADSKIEPAALAALVGLVARKEISQAAAREVLGELAERGGDPAAIVADKGLSRAGEDELGAIVEQAMSDNPDAVEKIRAGNDKAIGAIIGAVMKATKGRADGGEVQRMVRERL